MRNATAMTITAADGLGCAVLDEFERWAADVRAREAADGRIRERTLRQAAEEDASFAGTLLDLAEQAGTVAITTVKDVTHAGPIVAVGADFVGVRTLGDRVVLITFATIADVSPTVTMRATTLGERGAALLEVSLAEMLTSAAAVRSKVGMRCGDRVLSGELYALGTDVATVMSPGPPTRTSYVVLSSISEVSFLASG